MSHGAELVVDARAIVGEGPMWDVRQQVLYWLDIIGKKFHVYDPASDTNRIIQLDQMPGTVVPRRSGGLMLALENGFAAFDPETQEIQVWSDPESDRPGNRFNDGKCDPAGRFWAGTMAYDGNQPSGSLYCLDTDRSVRHMIDGVTVSNGLVWTADSKTMYYIDSAAGQVDAFDYNAETGDIHNRRAAVKIPDGQGVPDGMTIDIDDNIWVAQWGGNGVSCWDPQTRRQIGWIDVPASQVSACWFGGPKLDELYITTARIGLDDDALAKHPHAGGLFRTTVSTKGFQAAEYGG